MLSSQSSPGLPIPDTKETVDSTDSPLPSQPQHNEQPHKKPTIIVLAGATAVGKSKVAAILAGANNGVVVSADSVQSYKGVFIGANKPSMEERLKTPHLLIDLIDPRDPNDIYTAADWRRDALYTIQKLLLLDQGDHPIRFNLYDDDDEHRSSSREADQKRRSTIDQEISKIREIRGFSEDQPIPPIVVGGTMMYLRWLMDGEPDAFKPSSTAVAKARDTMAPYESVGDWEGAVQKVKSIGESLVGRAEKLSRNDWYRVRRMMENAYTAQEMDEQKQKKRKSGVLEDEGDSSVAAPNGGDDVNTTLAQLYSGERRGGLKTLDAIDVRCFFLCPESRMTHLNVIGARCEQMICRGLLRETTDLALAGSMNKITSMAIGYRQALEYLARKNAQPRDMDAFLSFVENFAAATRNYSTNQLKWYRKDPEFVFVPVPEHLDQIKDDEACRGVAREIERLVQLPRDEFDNKERLAPDSNSTMAKEHTLLQRKGMRFFQFTRRVLSDDSPALFKALDVADLCTHDFSKMKTPFQFFKDEEGNNRQDS